MQLEKLCAVDEFPDNSMRRFTINGREILLARYENQFHALSEKCTHRGGSLSEGTLEDGIITCPLHFGQFDVRTGKVVGPPPMEPLQTVEVTIENGAVYITAP